MKKIILTLVAVIFLATAVTVVTAADAPESFSIDYLQKNKPAVSFPHKMHSEKNKIECKTCHHTLKEGGEPKACKTCHLADKDNETDAGTAPKALFNEKGTKNIFHERCKGCHKDGGKGPTKCKECHPK